MREFHELSARLAEQPGWPTLNAYERAKLACAELLRAGAPIPAWTALRELIGKGSANDINRAKKDFRLEHAESLRKLEGFAAEGVPDTLSPHIVGLWQEALAHAQLAYADKERVWQADLEEAVSARTQAQSELEHSQLAVQSLQVRVLEHEQRALSLQAQLQAEQTARAQAERMNTELRAELGVQRDRLDQALASAQAELEKAINRLQASERRAMMEIEHTRQDAAQKIADLHALLTQAQELHAQEMAQLAEQQQVKHSQIAKLQAQNAVLEQDRRALADQVRRADSATNLLREQHTAVLAQNAHLLSRIQPSPRLLNRADAKQKRRLYQKIARTQA